MTDRKNGGVLRLAETSPTASYLKAQEDGLAAVYCLLAEELCACPPLLRPLLAPLATTQGKGLRAACLLSCAGRDDARVSQDAVLAAASIELLHLASLIHDDVIDEAEMRRGVASLSARAGNRRAVLCGDYLLSRSLALIARVRDRSRYMELELPVFWAGLCLGEIREQSLSESGVMSTLEYFRVIRDKTASLFELSFFVGALIAAAPESEWRHYRLLGKNMGLIFQLTDDLLDLSEKSLRTGKDEGRDQDRGILTLPLIFSFRKDPELFAILKNGDGRRPELRQRLAEAVNKSAALERCRCISRRYAAKALRHLEQLSLSDEQKRRLLGLLDVAAGVL